MNISNELRNVISKFASNDFKFVNEEELNQMTTQEKQKLYQSQQLIIQHFKEAAINDIKSLYLQLAELKNQSNESYEIHNKKSQKESYHPNIATSIGSSPSEFRDLKELSPAIANDGLIAPPNIDLIIQKMDQMEHCLELEDNIEKYIQGCLQF